MSASQLRAWTEQQIAERHNFTTLPPPQVQQYFTGRFTQRDALQDTSTENSGWEHFAEIETTRREWIPILTDTPGGRNRTGVSNLSARVLGQHGAFRALDNCAHPLGQHHESGAPDVSAEVFKENDEQETSNVRTELSTQHAEPKMPNGPAELLINGVVYHRSSYGRRAEESSGNQFDQLQPGQVVTPGQQSATSHESSSWILESGVRLRPDGANPVRVTW